MPQIDLNCDMGESFGAWTLGSDAALLKIVTSANIACGFHAGDPDVMAKTMRLAVDNGVGIGAHPGFAAGARRSDRGDGDRGRARPRRASADRRDRAAAPRAARNRRARRRDRRPFDGRDR